MNNYNCIGNLTRDVESHVFGSGTKVVKFGIAVTGRVIKKDGVPVKDEKGYTQREVVFWDCEAWSNQADLLEQYAKKGSKLGLGGEIKEESWDDKTTGQKRSKKVLKIEKVSFLDARDGGSGDEGEPENKPAGRGKGRPKKEKASSLPDSSGEETVVDAQDIPF